MGKFNRRLSGHKLFRRLIFGIENSFHNQALLNYGYEL